MGAQIEVMVGSSSTPQRKPGVEKLGRSPVTGHFVMKPATDKGRTVSSERIRDAVRKLGSRKA